MATRWSEARAHAFELAAAQNLTFVHPYDDDAIVAGQGTVGLEMLQAVPDLDALVIAVGGGGLISGIATAAKALQARTSRSSACRRCGFPAMFNAIKGTHHPQGTSTIAEGIAVGTPGRITEAIIRERVDDLVLVDEGDIEQAVLMLLEIEKTVVEGAGAAGPGRAAEIPGALPGRKVGLVLCGGNIDPLLLAAIIERGMVRAGRLARLRVGSRDIPGALAHITAAVADAGANIDEVHHQRAFSALSAQNVEIELVLQTRGHEHVTRGDRASARRGLRCRPVLKTPESKTETWIDEHRHPAGRAGRAVCPLGAGPGPARAFVRSRRGHAAPAAQRPAQPRRRHAVRPGHDGGGRHRDGAGADQPLRRLPALHHGADEHQFPQAAVGPGRAGRGPPAARRQGAGLWRNRHPRRR